jgi:DnaK suppressor protein
MESYLSREDIDFFKNHLEEMQFKIVGNLQQASEELSGAKCCSSGGDESDLASRQQGLNIRRSISEKQSKMLEEIKYSLEKIQEKTYGICEMCEEPIAIDRLKVKMFARYCIDCREVVEKQEDKNR